MAMGTVQPPVVPATEGLLVVGLGQGFLANGAQKVPYVALSALDSVTLRRIAPDLILCALFGSDLAAGDAFASVERLESLRYRGRILVLCQGVPRPDLIEAELQALGPGSLLTLISRD
jgi:hypothetical protein